MSYDPKVHQARLAALGESAFAGVREELAEMRQSLRAIHAAVNLLAAKAAEDDTEYHAALRRWLETHYDP